MYSLSKIKNLSLFYLIDFVMLVVLGCDSQSTNPSEDRFAIDKGVHDDRIDKDLNTHDQGNLLDMEEHLIDFEGFDMEEMPPQADWAIASEVDGEFWVKVTLDDQPLADALITQGGSARTWRTDSQGLAYVRLDQHALDALVIFGSSEQARTRSIKLEAQQREPIEIKLNSAIPGDQPAYDFSDPGEPNRRPSTAECGHCHLSNNDHWYASPHRSSAKNPTVYDLYMGRASGLTTEEECHARDGHWALAQQEGQDELAWQCFQQISALGAFNASCITPPCDTRELAYEGDSEQWGGCADCHAPAINGVIGGGQDLLSARGHAFDYGVSCDLCHHVAQIDWSLPAGVGGRLTLWRPQEEASFTLGAGGFLPLSFGPSADVSNPRMGISPRAHFRSGALCGGCHQHNHRDEHARSPLDPTRWPQGQLPNQSTYAEWLEGPVSAVSACNGCHMPPLSGVMNSANLERFESAEVGVQGGWPRPHGQARQHSWWGPRQPEGGMLRLAAGLSLTLEEMSLEEALLEGRLGASQERLRERINQGKGLWKVTAKIKNIGAGHGLPTGEPMRHIMSLIEMRCGDTPTEVVGGDVVHNIGGMISQTAWAPLHELRLPNAQVGDLLRIVRTFTEPIPYVGYGSFGSLESTPISNLPQEIQWVGRLLSESERGLFKQNAVGELIITEIDANGQLTLYNHEGEEVSELWGMLGDQIILQRPQAQTGEGYAGTAGFSFARVMRSEDGQTMVPHFMATDILRDNRLAPGQSWQSEHIFSAHCDDPTAIGHLIYRPYPLWLAHERGWRLTDEVMSTVVKRASLEEVPSEPFIYPETIPSSEALTISLESHPNWDAITLQDFIASQGENLDAEREGDPLLIGSLPTLWLEPQSAQALRISHPESMPGTSLFTQSAWAQDRPSSAISANEQQELTLSPRHFGVASYTVTRQDEQWKGALLSLPHTLQGLSKVYQLTLGRAEARSATRRARPWPWRLDQDLLKPRVLFSDLEPSIQPSPLIEIDLSAPQALVNQSSLPIVLDLPTSVWVWGGDTITSNLESPSPRSPQVMPQQPLALLIPPGQGVLLWAREPLSDMTQLSTLGMTAHGGRSWVAGTTLAILSRREDPSDELMRAFGLERDEAQSSTERLADLAAQLVDRFGAPLDLNGEATISRFSRLPPFSTSDVRTQQSDRLLAASIPQIDTRWVYQGDRRANAWRIEGGGHTPQSRGAILEVRNLSAQAQSFSIEGHQHQLITESGVLSEPRAVSWIPIRGRILVIWPTDSSETWRVGSLHTPEAAEGLMSLSAP